VDHRREKNTVAFRIVILPETHQRAEQEQREERFFHRAVALRVIAMLPSGKSKKDYFFENTKKRSDIEVNAANVAANESRSTCA
jgi:hypothetical protein